MYKNFLALSLLTFVFVGCASKQPIGTLEATDYAMSCEALITEINLVRSQWEKETDTNTAKNVVGGILTMGLYSADKEKETMLRERAKNLQLIYTIKQAKGECKTLSTNDIKVDSEIVRTTKEAKKTITETTKTIVE